MDLVHIKTLIECIGIFGNIRIVTDNYSFIRLYLNEYIDSEIELYTKRPRLDYVKHILALLTHVHKQHILIIEGAGHALAHALASKGASVTEIEIDPIIGYLSDTFFGYFHGNSIIMDGKIYLQQGPQYHFNVVILDAFDEQGVPSYLVNQESLGQIANVLQPYGLFIINLAIMPHNKIYDQLGHILSKLMLFFAKTIVHYIPHCYKNSYNIVIWSYEPYT